MAIRIVIYLSLILLLSQCSSMYIPSSNSVPLLEEKKEIQLEFTASTTSLFLNGAYAFSNKYALMLNGNLSYGNFSDYYDVFTHKDDGPGAIYELTKSGEFAHKYGEIGFGRYNILQHKVKLEVFGGFGVGNATDRRGSLDYTSNYYLVFLQANIGKTLGVFDFGWAMRIATSFFDYSYQINYSPVYPDDGNVLTQNIDFNIIHIEPLAFLRVGNEKIKFVGRIGFSLPILTKSLGDLNLEKGIYSGYVKTTMLSLSIGVNYKIH